MDRWLWYAYKSLENQALNVRAHMKKYKYYYIFDSAPKYKLLRTIHLHKHKTGVTTLSTRGKILHRNVLRYSHTFAKFLHGDNKAICMLIFKCMTKY